MEADKLNWQQHSHITADRYYLTTEVAEVDGKKYYRHTKVFRTDFGHGVGKEKVTYSETLDSKLVTEAALFKMIELARKQFTNQ